MRTALHYLDGDAFGGTEQALLTLLARLRQSWRCVLVHHPAPGLAPLIDQAVRLGVERRMVPRGRAWWTVMALSRLLRTMRPSVFHAHLNWPLACKRGLVAAEIARVPAVIASMQLFADEPRLAGTAMERLIWAGVDRFVAVSDRVAQSLRHVSKLPARKIRLVRNGIAVTAFDRPADPALRRVLSGGAQRPLVLTTARLHAQKGHKYLIEAAAKVPEAMFLLAGDGPLRAALETQVRMLGLTDRVVFLGHRDDIADLLAVSDLFVLPSLFEGYPLAVMEAAAARKPIIATRIGGTDEAIRSGDTGLLVPPADSGALAEAIRTVLADTTLAVRLADAAKAHALREFSAETMCRRTLDVYEEVLSLHRGQNGVGRCAM